MHNIPEIEESQTQIIHFVCVWTESANLVCVYFMDTMMFKYGYLGET